MSYANPHATFATSPGPLWQLVLNRLANEAARQVDVAIVEPEHPPNMLSSGRLGPMSETPGSPEYYTPSADSAPPPVPQPQSISDAAARWGAGEGNTEAPEYSQQYAPPVPPAPYGYAPPPPAYAPGGPRSATGLAIASLVVGLVALITFWIPLWGTLLGIVAVILGAIALAKKQSKGMAISGILTGIFGAIASAGIFALIIWGASNSADYSYDGDVTAASRDGVTTLGPAPVNGSLSVKEQAFGPATYDDTVTWFVVILNNPGPGAYPNADVTVNALDASGAVIDTAWSYGTFPAGDTAIGSAFYDLGGAEVASLQVVAPSVDAMSSDAASSALAFSDLSATSDTSFTTVTGTAESGSSEALYGAEITVVARDASGEIIGSAFSTVEAMDPGDSAQFEALFYEPLPVGTTYEAYAVTY